MTRSFGDETSSSRHNAYAAFKRGNVETKTLLQHAETIIISPIVLGELFAGFDGGKIAKENRLQLGQFLESSRIKLYPITIDTAHFFSKIYLTLKKKGRPIPTNDMWIAAQTLEHGCLLCSYDKYFQEIDGLIIATSLADI